MRRIVWILFLVITGLIIMGNFFTYFIQEKFIFQPEPLDEKHQFEIENPFIEVFLDTEDGDRQHALYIESTSPIINGCILYLHGNAGNLKRWSLMHSYFTDKGYHVLMPDYRGFGKSSGKLKESNLLNDAELYLDWLKLHCDHSRIIIYGRSMGAAPAAYLAAGEEVAHLILETPFSSMVALFYTYYPLFPPLFLFKFKLNTYKWLKEVKAPATIFHGTEDRIIPLSNSSRLKEVLKTKDRYVIIEGATHNDINAFQLYHSVMDSILIEEIK